MNALMTNDGREQITSGPIDMKFDAASKRGLKRIILLGVWALLAHSVSAAETDSSVSLESKSIAFGGTAPLAAAVSPAFGNKGALPNVDGEKYTPTGPLSRSPSNNGEAAEGQSLDYLITDFHNGTQLGPGNGLAATTLPVPLPPWLGARLWPIPGSLPPTELAPNRVVPGWFVSRFSPLVLPRWLLVMTIVELASMAVLLISLCRLDRLTRDTSQVRASHAGPAICEQLCLMEAALEGIEAGDFFGAARCALQYRLGELWELPPATVTVTDINARLGDVEDLRRIFEMADEPAYNGWNLSYNDLAGWRATVMKELERLQ